MKNLIPFATFIIGAAIGSVATWFYAKKRYEKIAQEEIDSVKQIFTYKKEEPNESSDESIEEDRKHENVTREKPDITQYAKMLSKQEYTNYSKPDALEEDPEPEEKTWKAPYVISPDEFGEFDDYDKISLTFYSDHILCDDDNEPVEDVESTIGFESLNHFGEYEDDSVFVRNERLKVDYEILLDLRKYSDVLKDKPYLRRS